MVNRLLKNLDHVTNSCPPVSKFVLCYAHHQPIYQEMLDSIKQKYPNVETHVFSHYPNDEMDSDDFWPVAEGTQSILILDDVLDQVTASFEKMLRGLTFLRVLKVYI